MLRFTLLIALLCPVGALAQDISATSILPSQGRLNDATGVPIVGTVGLTFSIYETFAASTPLYRESHSSILAGGTYSVPVSYTHLTLPTICSV